MKKLIVLLVFLPVFLFSQEKDTVNIWEPFTYFIGSWEGDGGGVAGKGKGDRIYQYILKDRFIYLKDKSTFEPQEMNPEGEIHLEWSFFSYDKNRKNFMLREFHGEGYVNTYALDGLYENGKTMVFLSEHIENGPPDMRARLTYSIINEKEFTETFEIATKGQDFKVYIVNRWKRKNNK